MAISETAATYVGISNENEFYSHHYLSEVFKGDIKQVLEQWAEKEALEKESKDKQLHHGHQEQTIKDGAGFYLPGYKAPYNQLKTLARDYFSMRERLRRERSANERVRLQRQFFQQLLKVIEQDYHPHNLNLEDGYEIPVLGKYPDNAVNPELVIIGAYDKSQDDIDPLSLTPDKDQYLATLDHELLPEKTLLKENWNEIISKHLYAQNHPPRWVILLSDSQLLLIDRAKWNQNRLLRFDWDEILSRRDDATLKATCVLLHKQSLFPDEGISLLDSLDENAHKHAFAVSEDLKYALRQSIEKLGNEAAHYLIENKKMGYTGKNALDATDLTRECLRYMYRLLFLFYIEARPELGYVPPNKLESYWKGYSLESLRDLEMVRLTTAEARNGRYFHQSIQRLFSLIHKGSQSRAQHAQGEGLDFDNKIHNTFVIDSLDSHLFNPKYTPLLNKVVFRNETLQNVIKQMSLTRPVSKGKKRQRRGRVSYSQLGINQLGAVYEALLSYRGFFADEVLYEVKRAGTTPDELETGYFVSAKDLELYTEEERVFDKDEFGHKKLRLFSKGTFIYRLAGRDRQKSASYYTPEVLTRTLVKYALKELLQDKSADDLLQLTICEPAMGSAAFLNEAVNQLSQAYLERKQIELNQRIPQEHYGEKLQQVKMYIADRNTYGVDLNPVAVELAEISLWLNAIHGGKQVPWFGYQLFNGNSLIGARRQVYETHLLGKQPKGQAWYDQAPARLNPFSLNPAQQENEYSSEELKNWKRSKTQVYHFLLPDPGMAAYNDKVAKSLAADQFEALKKWNKQFTRPFAADDMDTLLTLSEKIDSLWVEHAQLLAADRERTEDAIQVWPDMSVDGKQLKGSVTSTSDKDRIRANGIFNLNAKSASQYRRLKMVMDYWSALWFWPIDKAGLLPDRDTFLMEIGLLIHGNILDGEGETVAIESDREESTENKHGQFGFDLESVDTQPNLKDSQGQLNIERLFQHFPRLKLVHELAEKHKFFHWELAFADIFAGWGGFDLILGNPPWIKVEWEERGVLGDYQPLFNLRKFSAKQLTDERSRSFDDYPDLKATWFEEFEQASATQSFLNATQNYPLLKGVQTNLYKCFIPQAWMVGNPQGVSGFLHPEGIYDDPKGGKFREEVYPRLRAHFQFVNVKKLFSEVLHWVTYSINIYGKISNVNFKSISNLFIPKTIGMSIEHNGTGLVGGIKDESDNWNVSGHKNRIINVDNTSLELFVNLYDEVDTPSKQARLPVLHSQELLSVLEKFARQPRRLGDLKGEYFSTVMFDEAYAQRDGIIKRKTCFPKDVSQWILSGPHFFVGNPFYKTPRKNCKTHLSYDVLDLTELPDDYLPRTNYIPACDEEEYKSRIPRVPWIEKGETEAKRVTEYYRFVNREMIGPSSERTLICTLLPKKIAHINTCLETIFKSTNDLLDYYSMTLSVTLDYRVKSTGMGHANTSLINQLPLLTNTKYRVNLHVRALILCCLSNQFKELWETLWKIDFKNAYWTKNTTQLKNNYFDELTPTWNRNCVLRTDYERRQALVEIDVLASMALGLTLEELQTIYRVQFPVMRQYEKDTWYDANGRIVFTASKGLIGVGLPRKANKKDNPCEIQTFSREGARQTEFRPIGWEDIRDLPAGSKVIQTVTDDTLPGGLREKQITYLAPFDKCDREEDYKTAWKVFSERFSKED